MLFKGVRAGDEVILATPLGRGPAAGYSYALAAVEAVKAAQLVVAGFKFGVKDGRGRTVPHHLLPATPENRRQYLGGDDSPAPVAALPASAGEAEVENKLRKLALDALRVIREEADPADDDSLIDLLGVEALAAFRRQWRRLRGGPK